MKRISELILFASLLVVVACDSDNDNEKSEEQQWPTTEEMAQEEYFPIGTKWTEVWEAYQIIVDENGKAIDRDTIPRYYYVDYTVEENTTNAAMPNKHVSIKHQLEPIERRTNWQLYDIVRYEFFIEEKDGIIYQTDYMIVPNGHKVVAYDFVWEENKELYTTTSYSTDYVDNTITRDSTLEVFGTVTKESVEFQQLNDGKTYMYMPSAKLYRGIGRTVGLLFPIPNELRLTAMLEFEVKPVGLARFYRNDQLIYENKELTNKVEAL